jgi:hypothetical protein
VPCGFWNESPGKAGMMIWEQGWNQKKNEKEQGLILNHERD